MFVNLELTLTLAKKKGYGFSASTNWLEPSKLFTSEFRLLHLILRLMCGNQYVQDLPISAGGVLIWTTLLDVDVVPVWLHELVPICMHKGKIAYPGSTQMEQSCFSLLLLLFFHVHFILYTYIATFSSALDNALCKLFHGTVYI